MQNQIVISIFLLLVLVASPLSLAFASTESNDDYLNIREATIDANSDEMNAFLETHGHIPTNGDGGAFGYGVLTSEGLDAVVVSPLMQVFLTVKNKQMPTIQFGIITL